MAAGNSYAAHWHFLLALDLVVEMRDASAAAADETLTTVSQHLVYASLFSVKRWQF